MSFESNLGVLISKNHVAEMGNVSLTLFLGIFLQNWPKTTRLFCNLNLKHTWCRIETSNLVHLHTDRCWAELGKKVWECTISAWFWVISTKNHQKNPHIFVISIVMNLNTAHQLANFFCLFIYKRILNMNMFLTLDTVWECKLRGFKRWKLVKMSKNAFFLYFLL